VGTWPSLNSFNDPNISFLFNYTIPKDIEKKMKKKPCLSNFKKVCIARGNMSVELPGVVASFINANGVTIFAQQVTADLIDLSVAKDGKELSGSWAFYYPFHKGTEPDFSECKYKNEYTQLLKLVRATTGYKDW
jgi:hypothetical protein